MAIVVKYVGDGSFINGLPARDLTDEDWEVIGRQGRQQWVIDSDLYEVLLDVAPEKKVGTWTPIANLDLSKDVEAALLAGFLEFVEEVNAAPDEQLLALDGIGPAKLKEIRTAVARSMASDVERLDE